MSLYQKNNQHSRLNNFYRRTRHSVRNRQNPSNSWNKKPRVSFESKEGNNEIVINLSHCKYPIIKKIAEDEFNMRVSKNPNNEHWDVYWSDVVKNFFEFR